jgi:hypoxanthine phosphoribosyltransferase
MSNDKQLVIAEETILKEIASLAQKIDDTYQGQEIVIVMILKGSICFVADLIRQIKTPFILETIQCKSYGMKGSSRGDLQIIGLDDLDLSHKHVLVVDDIFDSGVTMASVLDSIQKKHPQTLRSAVLLSKQIPRSVAIEPDYVVFPIDNIFVIGYGLDFKELYRGLRGIYKIIS